MPDEQQPTNIQVFGPKGRIGEATDALREVSKLPNDKVTLYAIISLAAAILGMSIYTVVFSGPRAELDRRTDMTRTIQDRDESWSERLRYEQSQNRALLLDVTNRVNESNKVQAELNRLAREQEFKLLVIAWNGYTAELKELRTVIDAIRKKLPPGDDEVTVPDRLDDNRRPALPSERRLADTDRLARRL